MNCWILVCVAVLCPIIRGAVIADTDVEQEGLYSKSDEVVILTGKNFERKIYGQRHALLVQFYNSYCGHCRSFAPRYKSLASEIISWKPVFQLAVIDCSVEDNNGICSDFEVAAYPSLRYFHENYIKGNANIGDRLQVTETAGLLKHQIVHKIQSEQSLGRFGHPSLSIASYVSFSDALKDVPNDVLYTFLVFENDNSTVGSELALDINAYNQVKLKRVHDTSELTHVAGVHRFPGLVAATKKSETTQLTPENPTRQNLLKAINDFLKTVNYNFPKRTESSKEHGSDYVGVNSILQDSDTVFYSDLEKTIKTSLHTEIVRHKILRGVPRKALLDYLDVLINSFPARGNLRVYLVHLRHVLEEKDEWNGSDIYKVVKELEEFHAPVYTSNLDYVGCKGSQPQYRGYTCGLWTLYHTLTVNAAQKPGLEGPKVLRAMHGYVKYFFGCTECSEHFQAMAAKNHLFDVNDNKKSILWLWISHNEVNLRLAGDITEDPLYPKIQYPSVDRCPECRLSRGAWNLPAVSEYLSLVYGADNIRDSRRARSAAPATSPFSNLDLGMLSLLYILSFIILIIVINFFFSRRFYRKRYYKHGRGKV